MKRSCLLVVLLLFPAYLGARQDDSSKLTGSARQGELLFQQRCSVCHARGRGDANYGPRLSKETVASEGYVRKQVMDGGQMMPGFKYTLQPPQIDSIIAYLKTVEPR